MGIQQRFMILLVLIVLNISTVSTTKIFNFNSFRETDVNLMLLGDSVIKGEAIVLGRDASAHKRCQGGVFFKTPVYLADLKSNKSISFKTYFTISASVPTNPPSMGDGICLLFSPTPYAATSAPFGLPDAYSSICLDTRADTAIDLATDLYLRLFSNSLVPLESSVIIEDIRNGEALQCWVEYKAPQKTLIVFIGSNVEKPDKPVLNKSVDFPNFFLNQGRSYIGFTSASENCVETYRVKSWELDVKEKKHFGWKVAGVLVLIFVLFSVVFLGCLWNRNRTMKYTPDEVETGIWEMKEPTHESELERYNVKQGGKRTRKTYTGPLRRSPRLLSKESAAAKSNVGVNEDVRR